MSNGVRFCLQEVDMAILLTPSVERSRVVDCSVPLEFWYYGVAVRKDRGHVTPVRMMAAFLTPFHWTVTWGLCFHVCV